MEQSLTSLTYKGSIPQAITEAKKQRKLFVVYISGEDTESSRLGSTTWTDAKAAEAVSKYCILLHLAEGSSDAAQFSAIYPQRSIPCITAVGYNGVQLWQNEGFVSAEDLASSLEKVWLSLHLQDTTVAVLSAALASKTPEPSTSVPSDEGSSSVPIQSPSTSKLIKSSEAKENLKSDKAQEEERDDICALKDIDSEFGDPPSSRSSPADVVGFSGNEKSSASTEAPNTETEDQPAGAMDGSHIHEKANESNLLVSDGEPKSRTTEAHHIVQDSKGEAVDDKTSVSVKNLSDVHLNIRMPHGTNLQEKFSVTSTLRTVKEYIDEHQESAIGAYDLAIPYPRQVYSDQDLTRTLSELGLFDRQALIVVPRQQTVNRSSARTIVESSNESNDGYFSYVKKLFSFINPLSYLGSGASSSDSEQPPQHGLWEHSSNSTPRNNSPQTQRPSTGIGNARRPVSSRSGSNIHTLRHDEDDERFKDNNSYWNGNSTQYGGGNDNGK